jgi:integrase
MTGREGIMFPRPSATTPRPFHFGGMIQLMRHLGEKDAVPHGMRSSMRDWMGDVGNIERDVAEACLAHVVGGTEGAYRRSDAFEKRRVAMAAWGAFLAA